MDTPHRTISSPRRSQISHTILDDIEAKVRSSMDLEGMETLTDHKVIQKPFIAMVSRFLGEKLGMYMMKIQKGGCKGKGRGGGEEIEKGAFSYKREDLEMVGGEWTLLEKTMKEIERMMNELMVLMGERMRIRETELIQGLVYLERFLMKGKREFMLTMKNVAMAFTTCVMLSNKMNGDSTFRNISWCEVFGIKPSYLNESERYALRILEFRMNIRGSEISELLERMKLFFTQ